MAKITVGNITVEGTVEELIEMGVMNETEGYRKVTDREPKVGDYVKFTANPDNEPITVGKYYEIEDIDSCDDPHIEDDTEDYFDCCGEDYEVYEKVGEVQAEEGESPKSGDVVRTDSGRILTLTTRQPEKDGSFNGKGWSYEGCKSDWIGEKQFTVIEASKTERLEVGDYAKVVKSYYGRDGDIVEVLNADDYRHQLSPGGIPNKSVIHGDVRQASLGQLVKATDEEVAKAKAEAKEKEEKERWKAIGREVNEFKVGDIFQLVKDNGSKTVGSMIVVAESLVGFVRDSEGFIYSYGYIQLITPVEQRFDLSKESA